MWCSAGRNAPTCCAHLLLCVRPAPVPSCNRSTAPCYHKYQAGIPVHNNMQQGTDSDTAASTYLCASAHQPLHSTSASFPPHSHAPASFLCHSRAFCSRLLCCCGLLAETLSVVEDNDFNVAVCNTLATPEPPACAGAWMAVWPTAAPNGHALAGVAL